MEETLLIENFPVKRGSIKEYVLPYAVKRGNLNPEFTLIFFDASNSSPAYNAISFEYNLSMLSLLIERWLPFPGICDENEAGDNLCLVKMNPAFILCLELGAIVRSVLAVTSCTAV